MKAVVKALLHPLRRTQLPFDILRILRPPRWLYQHLHFTGVITVKAAETASFRMHHFGAEIENELYWSGYGRGWEAYTLKVWRALCLQAKYIVDVGANTGVFGLAAMALNPRSEVMAIEPVPNIYAKLVANVELNRFPIKTINMAASDTDGEVTIYAVKLEHSYSSSLEPRMIDALGPDFEVAETRVTGVRLDTLFDDVAFERVDLLKIDVERHEPMVLAGMRRHLERDRPAMIIEILDAEIGAAVQKQIAGLGYRCFLIDEEQGLVETTDLLRRGTGKSWNYLLCRDATARSLPRDLYGPQR